MKREMDLVRQIILAIRDGDRWPSTKSIYEALELPQDQVDYELFGYHVGLLVQAGLVDGIDAKARSDRFGYHNMALTWAGQDFADSIENDTVWSTVKSAIKDKGLQSAAFSVWAQLATQQLSRTLGLS